jgi:hypothetical protein
MNNQQRNLDYLYERLLTQKLRVDIYNCKKTKLSPQSCWNNNKVEKKIFSEMVKEYKDFLIKRSEYILEILENVKNERVNSLMTYDKNYYEIEFEKHKNTIGKYKDRIILSPSSTITKIDFSKISDEINNMYQHLLLKPTLFSTI